MKTGYLKLALYIIPHILGLAFAIPADINMCVGYFGSSSLKKLEPKDLRYPKDLRRPEKSTVVTENTITDKNGSTLLVIRKTGEHWDSLYGPASNNDQGDPRWFPIVLGAKAGAFFGFHKISEDIITIPTAETFNARIEKANKILISKDEEPIVIRFYETGTEPITQAEYLLKMLNEKSLPMAKEGHYALHDISYHTLAILLPQKILYRLNAPIRLVLLLKEKIEKSNLNDAEKAELLRAQELGIDELVKFIDFGTGNVAPVLAWEKAGWGGLVPNYDIYNLRYSVINNLLIKTKDLFKSIEATAISKMSSLKRNAIKDEQDKKITEEEYTTRTTEADKSIKKIKKFMEEFKKENQNLFRAMEQKYTIEELAIAIRSRSKTLEELK